MIPSEPHELTRIVVPRDRDAGITDAILSADRWISLDLGHDNGCPMHVRAELCLSLKVEEDMSTISSIRRYYFRMRRPALLSSQLSF
jgi:hypothetical protein